MRRALLIAAVAAAVAAAPAHAEDPLLVPDGVTIAGTAVGGMTAEEAEAAVRAAFDRPVALTLGRRRWSVSPVRLGASADIAAAVQLALAAPPDTALPLGVQVTRARLRAYVGYLGRRFSHRPRDARLVGLRRLRPFVAPERRGRKVRRAAMRTVIVRALLRHGRGPLRLRVEVLRPRVTRATIGPVVVIRRGSRRLYLYDGMRLRRSLPIAVGMPRYPTPLGLFRVVSKLRNPWWIPPDSDWAAGLGPVPPGTGNPLGTRWIGLSAPGIGIHGTPVPSSIGTAASHGCIRMYMRHAEWLFERVRLATPVFIVRA